MTGESENDWWIREWLVNQRMTGE